MTEREDFNEKNDRQQRFQRRRSRAQTGVPDDMPRQRRTNPYKRQHDNYLEEWDDEDEWFESDN